MMTGIEWIAYGALGVSACLAVALMISERRFRIAQRASGERTAVLQQQLDSLARQLDMLNKGTLGMGRRLMTAEKRLNQTMERQDSLESREFEQRTFKQAAKLFERGLEMDNVIEKVGITRTEAKLLDMIQQKQIEEFEG